MRTLLLVLLSSSVVVAAEPCCSGLEQCLTQVTRPTDAREQKYGSNRLLLRSCEATALAKFGPPAVPRLIPLLTHANPFVRDAAAVALGDMGSSANSAIPALLAAAEADPGGRWEEGLAGIDDPRAAPGLTRLFALGLSRGRELKPKLWEAVVPLAIEALAAPSTTLEGRIELVQLLQTHPDLQRPISDAHALHRLLKKELEKPKWDIPPGCASRLGPVKISFHADPCELIAGALISGLERSGAAANFAAPEVEAAIQREPALLASVGHSTLKAMGTLTQQEVIKRRLVSGPAAELEEVLQDAAGLPSLDAEMVLLVRALLKPGAPNSGLAAFVLARRGMPDGLEVVRHDLGEGRYAKIELALATAKLLKRASLPVVSSIRRLMETQQPKRLRQAAADAISAILELPISVPAFECKTRSGHFETLPGSLRSCAPNEGCIVGVDRGEFGGLVSQERADGGKFVLEDRINPRALFAAGKRRYVLSGLSHLGLREGSLWRVVSTGGASHLEFVADLPGAPVGWRLERDSLVVVVVPEEDCAEHVVTVPLR